MIVLVPKWAHHYDEFWNAIRTRNLWFIKIRYLFVVALLLFVIGGQYLLELELSSKQIIALPLISFIILLYNIGIQLLRRNIKCIPGKFNPLHLSLLQMMLDLITLLVLIYYTGAIDSPLYIFAIFHTIIGSLILPGIIVYTVLSVYLLLYCLMIFLQHLGILHAHHMSGMYLEIPEHNLTYVLLFLIIYASMLLLSVYIANRISYQLYKREQQLKSSLDQIEEVEEKKQKYIIGVVHEIKSPISAIQSIADLILDEYIAPLPDILKEKIERIKIRSMEGLNLVNNVLFISRLRLLNLTSTEKIDVLKIIQEVVDKRCSDMSAKEIKISINDKRSIKQDLQADKILIELAISNLICNAFKYTPNEGRVDVDLMDDDSSLTIEIIDSGIGIPGNEIKNVMNEFYRATNAKKQKFEGSGLGLALVKEVIDLHGGSISIKSPSKLGNIQNPGTSITIRIPYSFSSIQSDKKQTIDDVKI